MNQDFFHMYGMRILLSGDVVKARERAQLARVLAYQTDELLNVNKLDIVSNKRFFDDGTKVYYLNQHGLKTAHIYVPPSGEAEKRYRERPERNYYPAFEAYDASDNHIGYVIARGGGWQPPYEFVQKTDSDHTDPFEWGQWLENYETPPYEDYDTYVAPNLVFEEPGKTYNEIPPTGTKNRMFSAEVETIDILDGSMGSESCDTCCYFHTSGSIHFSISTFASFYKLDHASYTRKFTLGAQGEAGDKPDSSGSYETYWPWENVYEFGVEAKDDKAEFSGVAVNTNYSLYGGVPGGYPQTCAGAEAYAFDENGADCTRALANYIEINPLLIRVSDGFFDAGNGLAADQGSVFYDYTVSDWVNSSNSHFYKSICSSAEDAEHFGLLYDSFDYKVGRGVNRSPAVCAYEQGSYPEIPQVWETLDVHVEAVLSGDVFKVHEYTEDELDQMTYPIVRYYRAGDFEFLLGEVLVYADDGWEDREARYVFISKDGDSTFIEYDVTIDRVDGFSILPDITDQNGDTIYLKDKFRLIREDKIIREEVI